MILVTCAVRRELAGFRPPPHVEVLVTGIGPVESAVAVSRALAQSRYELVVNAGIAGSLDPALNVGDAVAVTEELFELDLETGVPLSLPEDAAVVDRARSDLTLVDRLVERGFPSVRGITVGRVTASGPTAGRLAALGVQVETMEGFSVLRACEIAAVPAIEVRGISNIAGDREKGRWDFAAGVSGGLRILTALLNAFGTIDG